MPQAQRYNTRHNQTEKTMLKTIATGTGGGGGGISGSGTTNYLPKFASSTSVGDSNLLQGGTTILKKVSAAPPLYTSANDGSTIPASDLCNGTIAFTLAGVDYGLSLPTGASIDTQLGLSGSTPINVTFDVAFSCVSAAYTGNYFSVGSNTGIQDYSGSLSLFYFTASDIGLSEGYFIRPSFMLLFIRTGSATYKVYPLGTNFY